jgi:hypothetical protein
LDQVVTNPFRRATDGLQALRELAQLEQQAANLERHSIRSQDALQEAIGQITQYTNRLAARLSAHENGGLSISSGVVSSALCLLLELFVMHRQKGSVRRIAAAK